MSPVIKAGEEKVERAAVLLMLDSLNEIWLDA
jgi:hypothetical protein